MVAATRGLPSQARRDRVPVARHQFRSRPAERQARAEGDGVKTARGKGRRPSRPPAGPLLLGKSWCLWEVRLPDSGPQVVRSRRQGGVRGRADIHHNAWCIPPANNAPRGQNPAVSRRVICASVSVRLSNAPRGRTCARLSPFFGTLATQVRQEWSQAISAPCREPCRRDGLALAPNTLTAPVPCTALPGGNANGLPCAYTHTAGCPLDGPALAAGHSAQGTRPACPGLARNSRPRLAKLACRVWQVADVRKRCFCKRLQRYSR
jgi:hypothetical protein